MTGSERGDWPGDARGARGARGAGTHVWAPLLVMCWLCCWPDDSQSEPHTRRRSSDFFGRRFGSSAVSLHLPSTSGHTKQPLSAHRSHEEIRSHKKTHIEPEPETRYHSAPSVIDEVIHRRDWERSTKDLHIPLKPNEDLVYDHESDCSDTPDKPPLAEPESSSPEAKSDEQIVGRTCKKHYTNIKSSRGRKEKETKEDKDEDATETEVSNFYIGDFMEDSSLLCKDNSVHDTLEFSVSEDINRLVCRAKEAKQSLNESIRSKERPRRSLVPLEEYHAAQVFDWDVDEVDQMDRSGAMHHSIESRISMSTRSMIPPPSVEAVGYEGGACYLAEVGSMSELRGHMSALEGGAGAWEGGGRAAAGEAGGGPGSMRARHASDGDILAPPHRPESGAFSESDLDLDLEGAEDLPPSYDELQQYAALDRKETAI